MWSKPLSRSQDNEKHGDTSYCPFSVLKLTSGSSPVCAFWTLSNLSHCILGIYPL